MFLSPAELSRLEVMVASGQVRSDPPTPSPTDRAMEAMKRVEQLKAAARRQAFGPVNERKPDAPPPRATAPSQQVKAAQTRAPEPAGGMKDSTGEVSVASELHSIWNTPRSLEELIQIRQALLRNETPILKAP